MSRSNRLAGETSPYLLQHAHNPVDWHPWGPEALERSKSEDKPILLSIGYAACHWCHVMERESFENEATAALMNEHFINVKVDREERPDLDEIYMAATVAMSGSGGWPMTVFLTPDQQPFFAGTYFPPQDGHGRPGFPTLLKRIAQLWKEDRKSLLLQAGALLEELNARARATSPMAVGQQALDGAYDQLKGAFDPTYGGFGGAPKFPPSMALELLLRHHRRTGDDLALVMVRRTLDAMAAGGMRDHVGGGFARYSTDERWLVPHFEKMLYDNAQLARVYVHAFQVTGDPNYERTARETLDYVLREMTSEEGSFFSATDADSEGVEGKFFVWTPEQIGDVLPADQARAFCAYYDITPQGNWEGASVVNTPTSLAEVAADLDLDEAQLSDLLARAIDKLYAARQERVPPLLDDKILTSWNALMIGAMAECGRVLSEERYCQGATAAADAVMATMCREDGGLFRTRRKGKSHLDAYLEDYAYLSDALVDLYEATGEVRQLERARDLAERMVKDFHDSDAGGFFNTAHDHEKLVVRMRDGQDGAIPSANAMAARALVRLSWHLGKSDLRELALGAIRAHGKLIERAPRAFCASLRVVDALLEGPVEAVLAGLTEDAGELLTELGRHYLPNRMIVCGDASLAPKELLAGKGPVKGKPAMYLCRNFSCAAPASDGAQLAAQLTADRVAATEARATSLSRKIAGRATKEGTARYAKRHGGHFDASAYRQLGDLTVSAFGFGCYRVGEGHDPHHAAMKSALSEGCNVIDTSTNYMDGGSERLVGSVLTDVIGAERLARDELVVVSKIGYAQASNHARALAREKSGQPFEEMVHYDDELWHCIHPSFLDDQLERSLERLGLETLDVCLLHNPEYYLSDAAKKEGVTDEVRDIFYDRVRRAFAYFEGQVKAGRIGCYGVSSNTIATPEQKDATDLKRMLEAAREAGGEAHHFRVLQLPLNLLESGAARSDKGKSLLDMAAAADVAVLANRPLNAIVNDKMLRLALRPAPRPVAAPFAACLDEVGKLERSYRESFETEVPLSWAEDLRSLDGQLESIEQFEFVARAQIIPEVSRRLSVIEQRLAGAHRSTWVPWRKSYIRAVETAMGALHLQAAQKSSQRLASVAAQVDQYVPLARHGIPLQQKALWVLQSTPHLTTALVGMRRERYVKDVLAVMKRPPLPRAADIYRALDGAAFG